MSHDYTVIVPFVSSDVRKISYAVRPAKSWNELPADAEDFSSTRSFTNSLLKKVLSKYCAVLNLVFYVTAGMLYTCYCLQIFNLVFRLGRFTRTIFVPSPFKFFELL
jgi:hypothetical protein